MTGIIISIRSMACHSLLPQRGVWFLPVADRTIMICSGIPMNRIKTSKALSARGLSTIKCNRDHRTSKEPNPVSVSEIGKNTESRTNRSPNVVNSIRSKVIVKVIVAHAVTIIDLYRTYQRWIQKA